MQRRPPHRARPSVAAPASQRIARPSSHRPTSGYALVVDRQIKSEFDTMKAARDYAESLKRSFPALQIQVFDAEKECFELVEATEPG